MEYAEGLEDNGEGDDFPDNNDELGDGENQDAEVDGGGDGVAHARQRARTAGSSRRTAEDYKEHLLDPLRHGEDMTVLQACYLLCDWKRRGRVTDAAFNDLCWFASKHLLPTGNWLPPSLHIMKKVMDCATSSSIERHMCPNCGVIFPPLTRMQWDTHSDDECACGHARFCKRGNGCVPYKRLWYFGVVECIKRFWRDPIFAENNGTARDLTDPSTFLGSPRGLDLDRRCGNIFSNLDHASYYSIGAKALAGGRSVAVHGLGHGVLKGRRSLDEPGTPGNRIIARDSGFSSHNNQRCSETKPM